MSREAKPTSGFAGVPGSMVAALGVGLAFLAFLTLDQSHWWRLKADYAFGWLVPILVVYLAFDRWPQLQAVFRATGPRPLPHWLGQIASVVAGLGLGLGLALFLLGAMSRTVGGMTPPGSLALAAGFAGVLLGMVYFNTPNGRLGEAAPGVWRAMQERERRPWRT